MVMAKITVPEEHIDGFRYVLQMKFEAACEAQDFDLLRTLIAAMDRIRSWPTGVDVELPDALFNELVTGAWEGGNEIMADVYNHRARDIRLTDPKGDERNARSMIALAEAHGKTEQRAAVA
jgi:hypothetical protein